MTLRKKIILAGVVVCASFVLVVLVQKNFSTVPVEQTGLKRPRVYMPPVPPANKDATASVKKILAYFYTLSNGEKTSFVIGQQVGGATDGEGVVAQGYKTYVESLQKETGKTPVIVGVDYGWEKQLDDYKMINKILIDHYRKGGLVEISMSPGNPFTEGALRDFSLGGHRYKELVTLGSEPNKRWNAVLDKIAGGLTELRDADVVVLWRPLHEMTGDFFWWSYGESGRVTKEEFASLWKYTYEYLTKTKKLNNLLWVYSPSASMWENGVKDTDYYYPGDEYVDMVGMDYYADDMSQVNNHGNYDKLVALQKPFGFAEIGPQARGGFNNNLVLEALERFYPQTTYALYWTGWKNLGVLHTKRAIIENEGAATFMNSPTVITLERFKP